MRPSLSIPTALIVCAAMTASCASWRPAPAPLLPPPLPEMATRPCSIAILPDQPTWADLEAAYVLRGRQLVECDLGRRLAVETITGGRSAKSAGRRAISAWEGGVAAQSAEPALW